MQPSEKMAAKPQELPNPGRLAIEVPDHQLLRCIGKGGYGEVWIARSVLGLPRAVKLVHRSRFEDARPYEREFSGILRVEPLSRTHEGFIDILHVGRHEPAGYFYYVMELADDAETNGPLRDSSEQSLLAYQPRTLARELKKRGKLPFRECLSLGLNLAEALIHLHRSGLVHRDVKPSNILFAAGIPKLGDIGLVGDTRESASYVGTEGYIPPEGPGGPQSDIFSLGKVLYEVCTGHDRLSFPRLPSIGEDVLARSQLAELNAVILKACAPSVLDRYATAEEFHADLSLLQRGQSVRQQTSASKRARWTNAGIKAGLLVVGLGLGVIWSPRNRGNGDPTWVEGAPLTPQPVDLAPFYNSTLVTNWLNDFAGNDLRSLPTNWHRFGPTHFKTAGILQLTGGYLQNRRPDLPDAAEPIPVNRKCSRIHFLHGTVWPTEKGEAIGNYVIKWLDDRQQVVPIRYGHEIADWWWSHNKTVDADKAKLVWTGTNAATANGDNQLRLYSIVWYNSSPEVPVASISFYSTRSASAPFLLAITTE